MTGTSNHANEIAEAIKKLTLEEKAQLLSGADTWNTVGFPQLGIPSIMMSDGPYGLRAQPNGEGDNLGLGGSVPATAFPPPIALGASFDPQIIEEVAAAIGEEARQENVSVVLGPGVNIKRSPLCGRNFEYYSEDPLLAGELGSAWVKGIQAQGIGASLKHYAVNNQETRRMSISADVADRPLREIYLRPFEKIVREQNPWTIMCSYNRINGTYASENAELLNTILRDEWGYKGLVVSDWGAVLDRARSVAAGLDLEMPSSKEFGPNRIVEAVNSGELSEEQVDLAVTRVLNLVWQGVDNRAENFQYDPQAHHQIAVRAATNAIVMLRNEGGILPLDPGTARLAIIGEFARTPRFQGAGSSQIVPTQMDSALDFIKATATGTVEFAPGFRLDDRPDEALAEQAIEIAKDADAVVLFLGLPAHHESEGFDREDIDLPQIQLELLEEIVKVNQRVVVVLSNGSVVQLSSWDEKVPAILETWLLGQGGGNAITKILFGEENPSGRLTETIPLRIEDTPSFLNFPGEADHVEYGEGIFVGYRWYDAKHIPVAYPFGFGLSYTTFEYSDLTVAANEKGITVEFSVQNTGKVAGRDVPQVYVSMPESNYQRAPWEYKGSATVTLDPGETKRVTVLVDRADLAVWDLRADKWLVESGQYQVQVGKNCHALVLEQSVLVEGDSFTPSLTIDSTLGEWLAHPVAQSLVMEKLAALVASPDNTEGLAEVGLDDETFDGTLEGQSDFIKLVEGMRMGQLAHFPGIPVEYDELTELLAQINQDRS